MTITCDLMIPVHLMYTLTPPINLVYQCKTLLSLRNTVLNKKTYLNYHSKTVQAIREDQIVP